MVGHITYLPQIEDIINESTNSEVRIVFDASAEKNDRVGEILHTDPCLNSELYVVVRFCLYPVTKTTFAANVENTCNLIDRKECNIGRFVPLVLLFHSLTKNTTFDQIYPTLIFKEN